MVTVITCPQRPRISQGDIDVVSLDFRQTDDPYLDTGELLTGTPTAVEQTTGDLTIASMAVNTAAIEIEGRAVAVGEAVQFKVSGQQSGTTYRIRVTATTDATIARTKIVDVLRALCLIGGIDEFAITQCGARWSGLDISRP
jgi:hypothetical protein